MDIFKLAINNSKEIETLYKLETERLSKEEQDQIDRFSMRVENDGRIAINMKLDALYGFLESGAYVNVYEYARKKAAEEGKSDEEKIKEHSDKYHTKRMAFDGCFERSREFKYGALNIGGPGATRYKDFCAVLKHEISEKTPETAYLKYDSLNHYVTYTGNVDLNSIKKEIAAHDHRHFLAALKHITEIPISPENDWPNILCSGDDYIEVIFIREISPGNLEKVRIQESVKKYYERLAIDPDPDEQEKAHIYQDITYTLKKNGISIEMVN